MFITSQRPWPVHTGCPGFDTRGAQKKFCGLKMSCHFIVSKTSTGKNIGYLLPRVLDQKEIFSLAYDVYGT